MYRIPFDVPTITYADSLAQLHSALRFGIQPMLESVEDMLAELGNPDRCFRSIQIAGTNGKTSTARYTAAILMGEGLKAALYTSPELVSYTERMEVDGRPVCQDAFARGISAATVAGQRVNARRSAAGERPYDITEFDTLTVAAAVIFAEAGIDVAVLECGMGGRWDATSAFGSIQSVAVTGVGLDHMRILGDTLEKIASEKAAVIKPGRTCVLGVGTATPDSVEDVFLGHCEASGVTPVLLRPQRLEDAAGEMHAGQPREHADLPRASYAITQHPSRVGGPLILDVTTDSGATYRELSALKPSFRCPTPGRFDVLRPQPVALIDACHNPQSVQTFLTAVRSVQPKVADRPALLCAVLADKDVEGIVRLLAPEFPQVYVTQTSSPRALPAGELGRLFEAAGKSPLAVFASVGEAVEDLADVPFVACGSITTAGEVAAILRPGVQNARGGEDITRNAAQVDEGVEA